MNDVGKSFGLLLARYRGDAGLTQQELAERAGLGVRTIGALERSERAAPHRSTLRRLAQALGLPRSDWQNFISVGAGPTPAPPPASQVTSALAAQAAERVGRALHQTGASTDALREFELARRMHRQLGNHDGLARLHGRIAQVLVDTGRFGPALAEVLEAPTGSRITPRTQMLLAMVAARALELHGQPLDGLTHADRAVALAHSINDDHQLAAAYVRRGSLAVQAGLLDNAATDFEAAGRLASQSGDLVRTVQADLGRATVALQRGPLDTARLCAERALAGAEQLGDVLRMVAAGTYAASIAREQDDAAGSRQLAALAAVPCRGVSLVQNLHAQIVLALLDLDAGATAAARGRLEPIVDPAQTLLDASSRREALMLLATADLLDGNLSGAVRRLEDADVLTVSPAFQIPDTIKMVVDILVAQGRADSALATAESMVVRADTSGSVLHRLEALRAVSVAARALGRPAQAAAAIAQSRHLAAAHGFLLRERLLRQPPGAKPTDQ